MILLMAIITKHIPMKGRHFQEFPIWYSTALIYTIQQKNKFHRKFKRTGDMSARDKFRQLRNQAQTMVLKCWRHYVEVVEGNLGHHIKEFWRFTKSLKRTNTYPSDMFLECSAGDFYSSDSETVANLFAMNFQNDFSTSSSNPTCQLDTSKANSSFSRLAFCEQQIFDVLTHLQLDKGPGDDRISNFFLAMTAPTIAVPLKLIFNASLAAGSFSCQWKKTIIHPIFKKGDSHNICNYRPIAILAAMAKVFERLVHSALLHHVSPYLNECQHGFLPRKSTVTNLMEYVTFIAESLDRRHQIDVILVDFSKAFDKISHQLLLAKLQVFGVTGSMLSWFGSYLKERECAVVFSGSKSQSFRQSSDAFQINK